MIDIKFYIFNKKENSTKRPSSNDGEVVFNCLLKEPCGILNPTIALKLADDPHQYNYCYIPKFNRYYFITEWTYENSLWYGTCQVDTLASCKDYIGDFDLYILRSSAESNGRVMDTKYPTLTQANSYIDEISTVTLSRIDGSDPYVHTNYFSTSLWLGYYYIGVLGPNQTGVNYYCMPSNAFADLVDELFNFTPTDMEDVSSGVAKNLANPIQYITTCYWLPFKPVGYPIAPPTRTLTFGYYDISVACYEVDPVLDINKAKATFNIRKHPQANTRGAFLNNSPFSNYTLQFNPFGTFTLDSSLMIDDSTITCEWYVDYTTGDADLTIKASNSLISNTRSRLAIPIQLNQASVDYLGTGQSILSGAVGTVSSLFTGNIVGAVSNAVGGFIGATESMQPKIASIGGGGDFLSFCTYKPKIYSDFYYIADEFNDEIGRPLCKVRKPKNLGGYMVVLDGVISAPFTKSELQEVDNYLTGGFYYE